MRKHASIHWLMTELILNSADDDIDDNGRLLMMNYLGYNNLNTCIPIQFTSTLKCLETASEGAGIGDYDFWRKFAHGIKLDRDFIFLLRRRGRRRNADRRFAAVPSPSSSPFVR